MGNQRLLVVCVCVYSTSGLQTPWCGTPVCSQRRDSSALSSSSSSSQPEVSAFDSAHLPASILYVCEVSKYFGFSIGLTKQPVTHGVNVRPGFPLTYRLFVFIPGFLYTTVWSFRIINHH